MGWIFLTVCWIFLEQVHSLQRKVMDEKERQRRLNEVYRNAGLPTEVSLCDFLMAHMTVRNCE